MPPHHSHCSHAPAAFLSQSQQLFGKIHSILLPIDNSLFLSSFKSFSCPSEQHSDKPFKTGHMPNTPKEFENSVFTLFLALHFCQCYQYNRELSMAPAIPLEPPSADTATTT